MSKNNFKMYILLDNFTVCEVLS